MAVIATGLRQSSQRGYDSCSNGVTADVVTKQIDTAALQHRE